MAKLTVEDCHSIWVGDVQAKRSGRCSGTIHWYWALGQHASVHYQTDWTSVPPAVTLGYCDPDGSNVVRLPIRLQSTMTRHGGIRWWFSCPLVGDGVKCGRRCGRLYLPNCHPHFGCRHCHELTYQSSQEAHSSERLWNKINARWESGLR